MRDSTTHTRAVSRARFGLLSAGLALSMLAGQASAQVQFKSGTAMLSSRAMTTAQKHVALKTDKAGQHIIVQLDRVAGQNLRAQLAARGLTLGAYLGNNAYFASVDATAAQLDQLAQMSTIKFAGPIKRQWKLHPDLNSGNIVPWSVIDQKLVNRETKDGVEPDVETTVAAYVQFHPDVALDNRALEVVRRHGGEVRSFVRSINTLVIHLPYSQIASLADEDIVQWVEPPIPQFSENNAENRAITTTDIVQAAPYGLDGTGVNVLIYDGGTIRATHQDLAGRVTLGDTDGLSDHATHVAGTVGGTGAASGGVNRGMAPNVQIFSYGFEVVGGLQPGFLYTDPGDLEADYTDAMVNHGCVLSNNSIGSNVEPNGFNCAWQGDYGLTASLIDGIVRGSLGPDMRICWAAGNERQGSACDIEGFGDYYSVAPPGAQKNAMAVGALNANDDSVTSFTSWGPTDDGRMKPDISTPGCQSGGDGGVTSCSGNSDTGYSVKCGTSMASPTLCGMTALLLQDYRVQFGSPDPKGATVKAMWCHTAQDIVNPGPDYQTGYGSARTQAAIDFMRTGNFIEESVDNAGSYNLVVVVQPGDPEMKVTLAWDDFPGTPNVNPNLVNDLDLVVTSPSGTRFYPWTLNPANPGADAVQNAENHLDNIEQVFVNNPEPGGWLVEVRGTAVPQGPQTFSLCASPFLVNCSDMGIVQLNANSYLCEDSLSIKAIDCGLNTSDMVVDTVSVNVASDTDPVGINVVLTEVAPEAATFLGDIDISASGAPGALAVSAGDTITVTYNDADDGSGSPAVATDTAAVDCTAPMIAGVAATNVQPRSATIEFTTDEPARPTVRWGDACGNLTGTLMGNSVGTNHSLTITGLTDDTQYFFEVEATDPAGNTAVDDNFGTCYTFTTPEVPDFFTELFAAGNDLDGLQITFQPNATVDQYSACVEPVIGGLPVDPAGGTVASLGDDSPSQLVNITGGNMVSVYGVQYSSFYINPNGHITFTASDSDYTETLADHFDTPRVSACFDDFNPTQGGQVSWKQESDRMAITWEGVPQHNAGDSNTFQVELFFNGDIRITYLDLNATDGLAGLSAGNGLDPDYFPSDLSAYGACGPRPPFASNGSGSTGLGSPVDFNLVAADDGLPGGPLTYTIESLPANGFLHHIGVGQITSVPYSMGTDTGVSYAPAGLFFGNDSFTFSANDGGVMPDGGDSNTATISVSVLPTAGGEQVVHEFLVDDTNPGWTGEGMWAFGQPQGLSDDPASGFTGVNVLGYNLAGDYANSMPEFKLTSTAINMTGYINSTIEFQRWLGVERAQYDHARFQVSNDNTVWTTIWENPVPSPSINELAWSLQSYDISAVADNAATLYLRWTMGTTDTSVVYHGWNIDDIRIRANVPTNPCAGDANLNGFVDVDDLNAVLGNWGATGAAWTQGDMTGDGNVDVDDLNAVLGAWGTSC